MCVVAKKIPKQRLGRESSSRALPPPAPGAVDAAPPNSLFCKNVSQLRFLFAFSSFPQLQNANSAPSPVAPIESNLLGAGSELLSTELTSTCSELISKCVNCCDSHRRASARGWRAERGMRVLMGCLCPDASHSFPGATLNFTDWVGMKRP